MLPAVWSVSQHGKVLGNHSFDIYLHHCSTWESMCNDLLAAFRISAPSHYLGQIHQISLLLAPGLILSQETPCKETSVEPPYRWATIQLCLNHSRGPRCQLSSLANDNQYESHLVQGGALKAEVQPVWTPKLSNQGRAGWDLQGCKCPLRAVIYCSAKATRLYYLQSKRKIIHF